jgi:branched-chain amino acid transport system ATP-binding protein
LVVDAVQPADNLEPGFPILELERVGMNFGGVAALTDLHFAVEPGIVQAVIGPNGAGKTTLFNCVSGVLAPSAGEIRFRGKTLTGLAAHKIAELGVSRTFQHVALFKRMTVLENVMVGRHPRTRSGFLATGCRLPGMRREERQIRESARHYLDLVGMSAEADLPAGALPLGKQKTLEIARALATEPALVLLDEPAGGLNMTETEALGELIRRICDEGTTVMLVEHDMNLVMDISDHILVLHFGEKLAAGTPGEIKDDPAVIEAYLGGSGGEATRMVE